jgi:hypothetical protein
MLLLRKIPNPLPNIHFGGDVLDNGIAFKNCEFVFFGTFGKNLNFIRYNYHKLFNDIRYIKPKVDITNAALNGMMELLELWKKNQPEMLIKQTHNVISLIIEYPYCGWVNGSLTDLVETGVISHISVLNWLIRTLKMKLKMVNEDVVKMVKL